MVEVIKTGMYDSIQDTGRIGFQHFGVPISGVMDAFSASIANSILGNSSHAAVIESTIIGPQLKFHRPTKICISGANMNPSLNNAPVKQNTAIAIQPNDILRFGKLDMGCRAYIAVLGGFITTTVMKSQSMYKGITPSSRLNKGDILEITNTNGIIEPSHASIKLDSKHLEDSILHVYKGPEFESLTTLQQEQLLSGAYTISKDSNRMAYQFNELLANNLDSIITSLVLPGTVQLTPSGQLIILMRDCQITGGYPRILQLSEQAINIISQKFFGDKIRLKCIK